MGHPKTARALTVFLYFCRVGDVTPIESHRLRRGPRDAAGGPPRHHKAPGLFQPKDLPVMCEYSDGAGRRAFLGAATGGVRNEIPIRGLISGWMSRRAREGLGGGDGIVRCDLDREVLAVPVEVEDGPAEGDGLLLRRRRRLNPERRRRAQQLFDEGNRLIQADLLSVGPVPRKVCVADTGYRLGHSDLPSSEPLVSGTDITHEDGEFLRWDVDPNGHGTHLAGIVAALDNDHGVRGVGNLTLHITRGLDDAGRSRDSDVILAVEQCLQAGADVISLSLGTYSESTFYPELFRRVVHEEGKMVFASAANVKDATDGLPFYPASYPSVISVAGAKSDGSRWAGVSRTMSMQNEQVEITALAYNITSTYGRHDDDYITMSGTSMAAAYASGAAALLWSHFGDCTGDQIRNAMAATARNHYVPGGCDVSQGHGIIQIKDAYDLIKQKGCDIGGVNYISDTPNACDARPPAAAGGSADIASTPLPSRSPSAPPSGVPTSAPRPSAGPSSAPSPVPTVTASSSPSAAPSSSYRPSAAPSVAPSSAPSSSSRPSAVPSGGPSSAPTGEPSAGPSRDHSSHPSAVPTASPRPSPIPSARPSAVPTVSPRPSPIPSASQSEVPTASPRPSSSPSETDALRPLIPDLASVSTDRASYGMGEGLTVDFVNPLPDPGDWIGLFPVDVVPSNGFDATPSELMLIPEDSDKSLVDWSFCCGDRGCSESKSHGSVTFGGKIDDEGEYRAYLLRSGWPYYRALAASGVFRVGENAGAGEDPLERAQGYAEAQGGEWAFGSHRGAGAGSGGMGTP